MNSIPTISDQEFQERYTKAQALVREEGLDLLIVNSNEAEFANVRYFSDYWPIFECSGVIIAPDQDGRLLIGPESLTFAEDRSKIKEIRMMKEYREPADPSYPDIATHSFKDIFAEYGVTTPKRVGIAGYLVTTLPIIDSLKAQFPNTEFVNADEIMVKLRSRKSPQELLCMKKAFEIAEDAIGKILTTIKPGMTELEVVGLAQQYIYANGAEYEGMPQYVFSGRNTTHAISRPTHKIIGTDELIQLHISARVSGYSSGVGRPLVLGKMSNEMKDLVDFTKSMHLKTMEWMKAGIISSQVAQKYKQMFQDKGYGDNFLYGPCHGLGMIEVEAPWMEEDSNYMLEENMTFNVDTFAYKHGQYGLRWENGVIVKNNGIEMLSNKFMDTVEI